MTHAPEQKADEEQLKRALRGAKLKATPGRVEVLRILMRSAVPLHADAIAKQVTKKSIDPATVYRTLKSLKHARVIRQVNFEHDHTHYEIAAQEDHHHIVCTVCGDAEDFVGCGSERIEKNVLAQSKKFATISHHAFELFGVCRNCAAKLKRRGRA